MASHVPLKKNIPEKITKLFAASAFTFVLMMGIVNLFADMTYEGASSINGPFLRMLGASAVAIGIIAGIGEFLGYCLRFPAGYISDKTGKYRTRVFTLSNRLCFFHKVVISFLSDTEVSWRLKHTDEGGNQ